MVVDGDGQNLLRGFLANDILIQLPSDFGRFWNPKRVCLSPRILVQLLIQDPLANVDAIIANIDARPGDQLADLGMALSAERAHREV